MSANLFTSKRSLFNPSQKVFCKINNYEIKTSTICCYPTDNNFIKAHVLEINKKIKGIDKFKLIFSAHGLPLKIAKKDPYYKQIQKQIEILKEMLNFKSIHLHLLYTLPKKSQTKT